MVGVDDASYAILPRFTQAEPMRSTLTREQGERGPGPGCAVAARGGCAAAPWRAGGAAAAPPGLQCTTPRCRPQPVPPPLVPRPPLPSIFAVGVAPYTFENTVVSCQEDPGVGLAAELEARGRMVPATANSGGGGMPAWLAAAIAVPAALLAAAGGAALVVRRRRRRRRAASAGTVASLPPSTPRSTKMGRMESGELSSKLCPDEPAPASAAGRSSDEQQPRVGSRSSRHTAGSTGTQLMASGGTLLSTPERGEVRREHEVLWRAR